MIFSPDLLPKVLNGTKTQTRRRMKDGDFCSYAPVGSDDPADYAVETVYAGSGRAKYKVGQTLSICPGRGKAFVAKIRITAIRQERPIDISEDDARAEGLYTRGGFFDKLQALYGVGFDFTRPCWAISFELVEDCSRDE